MAIFLMNCFSSRGFSSCIYEACFTSKQHWVVLTQMWVKYGLDKPQKIGLKMEFHILTQLQVSLSAVHFLITFLTQLLGLSIQYLTQIWFETTLHFLV